MDANGEITLPDGSTAPVLIRPDGTAFVQDASGELTLIGQGASFVTEEDTVRDIQYDNAQGDTTAPPADEKSAG